VSDILGVKIAGLGDVALRLRTSPLDRYSALYGGKGLEIERSPASWSTVLNIHLSETHPSI
jgi:hypothetical protein